MSWFRRGAKLASSSSHANQARTDATCYCTLNVATALIDPPRVHVTAAFAVPGFVVADTFQVQDTSPSEPAVGVVLSQA